MKQHERYKQNFIKFATESNVLSFGEFTLKSGRISPWFYNSGAFHGGAALSQLGEHYAHSIVASGIEFDVLYGPAYKGIPLAVSTANSLYRDHDINTSVCFNRKEEKDHGEGGRLVGGDLVGKRVLIIDDVVTRGNAFRESEELILENGGQIVGLSISVDRQERGADTNESAIQQIKSRLQIPVISIINRDDVTAYLATLPSTPASAIQAMEDYKNNYGV